MFPKIPGLSKKLGELLAGRSARVDTARKMFKREIADEQEIITDHSKKRDYGKPVLRRLYKRDTQEMADIEMDGVIQVLSPGDVAFTLGQGNDTTIISNTAEWDPNNICMSLSSLVGGLVLLVGKFHTNHISNVHLMCNPQNHLSLSNLWTYDLRIHHPEV